MPKPTKTAPAIETTFPNEEKDVTPPDRRPKQPEVQSGTAVKHIRCKESSQIGALGQSLNFKAGALELYLRMDLGGVQVKQFRDVREGPGGKRIFVVPMGNIAHYQLADED